MGDYLKEAYLLAEINRNIDDEYQKLSDKLDNLRLSHNRKKIALLVIKDSLEWEKRKRCEGGIDWCFFSYLIKLCDSALFCDGRERSKR